MLGEVLAPLRQAGANGDWQLRLSSGALDGFLQSSAFKRNLARYDTEDYRPEETGGLFEGTKVVAVYGDEHWSAGLSRSDSQSPYVFSKPAPFLIGPVKADTPVELEIYRIDATPDLENARDSTIVQTEIVRLSVNQFWSPPEENMTFALRETGDRPVMFRVVALPYRHHYLHAYSRATGKYVYSALSNNVFTSFDFLAKMAKALALSPHFRESLSAGDRQNFVSLLLEMEKEDAAATSRWALVQALGRVDGIAAKQVLARYAKEPDTFLAATAAKALSNIAR